MDETNFRNVQCEEKNKEMFNDKFFEWEWRPSNLSKSLFMAPVLLQKESKVPEESLRFLVESNLR